MPDGKKPKILGIDDDDLVRATIVAVLERADVDVSEASDGDVGMRLFEEGAHDVVITDILMPNREGIQDQQAFFNLRISPRTDSSRVSIRHQSSSTSVPILPYTASRREEGRLFGTTLH